MSLLILAKTFCCPDITDLLQRGGGEVPFLDKQRRAGLRRFHCWAAPSNLPFAYRGSRVTVYHQASTAVSPVLEELLLSACAEGSCFRGPPPWKRESGVKSGAAVQNAAEGSTGRPPSPGTWRAGIALPPGCDTVLRTQLPAAPAKTGAHRMYRAGV